MYIPSAFRVDDLGLIHEIVRSNPFATLVSVVDGEPFATHLPLILDAVEGQDVLLGHVAKANPHWRAFGTPALVIFEGPHGYVSPSWYQTKPNVPTWNYVAVHAYGVPQIVESRLETEDHLREMVTAFDPSLADTHPESVSDEVLRRLGPGVVVFNLKVNRWEGKTKLNQNRAEVDRLAVRARYIDSELPDERTMATLMKAADWPE